MAMSDTKRAVPPVHIHDVSIGPPGIVNEYAFEWKAVVIALVKAQHLHEGKWRLSFHYGRAMAVNGQFDHTDGRREEYPAAVLPIVKLTLSRVKELDPYAVDAAVVNPLGTVN